MIKTKKAQMGLDVSKKFVLGILTLVMIGIITLIILFSVLNATTSFTSVSSSPSPNETYTNTSVTNGVYLNAYANSDSIRQAYMTCTIYDSRNATGAKALLAAGGNYTQTNCYILRDASPAAGWDLISWNISYTYTTRTDNILSLVTNTTIGTTNFYGNVPLWFSLLGVVVIILIISVILIVVNRFGGESNPKTPGL